MILSKNLLYRFGDNFSFIFQVKRKPRLILKILRSMARYLMQSEFDRKPLRNIDIALDYACNLTCDHCSCELMKKKDEKLSVEEYRRISREAYDLGAIYFAFTGGEPLLNKNLEELVQLFFPSSCLIGLQTNALLLDSKRIDSLYRAGVDVLQISLDSGDPEQHDSFRNKHGAYHETISNIEQSLKKGLKIIISSTITHSNIGSQGLISLLEYTKNAGLPIVISVPCPVGKWSNSFNEQLDAKDREIFRDLQNKYPHLRRDFHSNYMKQGCSAATEKLYITPYGDVIPCPFIHISFGNLKQEPLGVIRKRMLKVDRFVQYSQICLAGEDRAFINDIIKPTYSSPHLPLKWDQHPVFKNCCK